MTEESSPPAVISLKLEPSNERFIHRPRFLYTAIFAWIAIVGGRFLAPFWRSLEFSDGPIGAILAAQTAIQTICGGYSGRFADYCETQLPKKGRPIVLASGVTLGTASFLMHSLPTQHYSLHFFWQAIYAWSTTFIFPVMDGMTLNYLEQRGLDSKDYGKERLYGAISWAVTNLCLAPMLDKYGFSVLYILGPIAWLAVMCGVVSYILNTRSSGPVSTAVDDDSFGRDHESFEDSLSVESKISFAQLARTLFRTSYGISLVAAVICLSAGQAIVDSLSFLYFEKLGSSYSLMGIMILLTVAFEIPIFQKAPILLERLGVGGLLLLGSSTYVIRTIGYSLIPVGRPEWVLLLEPLHGITYGSSQTASVEFIHQLMPSGFEASGQGIINSLKGAGAVIGLACGGWAQQVLGARVVYRVAASVVLTGSTGFGLVLLRDQRSNNELSVMDDELDALQSNLELSAIADGDSSSEGSEHYP